MRVGNISNSTFKGARINIVANSDNHGNIANLPETYNTIKENRDRFFQKSEEKSTLNLYINAGDYFINGNKKGWRTNEGLTNFEVQKDFLRLLILKIKKQANITSKTLAENGITGENIAPEANFDALYTPGNHCFDGGDKKLYEILNSVEGLTTIMTNVDGDKSPYLKKYGFDRPNSNFVSSKEYTIDDDKVSYKKHHLMVLGATIPAFDFYNPGLIEGTKFVENHDKKDAKFTKEMIGHTIQSIREKVDDFKKRYPDGIIILSSHMGTGLSKMVRDEIPEINEILDGHKHDIATTRKGNTNISSLGEDNKILKAISLQIEDDGSIEREDVVFQTNQYKLGENQTNALKRLINGYTQEDIKLKKNIYTTYKEETLPIITLPDDDDPENPCDLSYTETIRFKNSQLANFLTTLLKQKLSETKGQEDLDIVGVQSSIIRGGLKNGANTFDLMKVFDGVSEDLSTVKAGKITGQELIDVIWENIKQNIDNPRRNTIIHWSDIQIDRSALAVAAAKGEVNELTKRKNILVRKGNGFSEIDPKKEYKIAIADKYLTKNDIEMPKKIRDRFTSTNYTYHQLFMDYLEDEKWAENDKKGEEIKQYLYTNVPRTIAEVMMRSYETAKEENQEFCIKYKARNGKMHNIPIPEMYKEERIK